MNQLLLRAAGRSGAPQVVWDVNGEPSAVAAPGETICGPMTPDAQRLELRLPAEPAGSRRVRILVE